MRRIWMCRSGSSRKLPPTKKPESHDVGGGESTLVDDLLAREYGNVSVLDRSSIALDVAKARLGDRAGKVDWLCGDVTTIPFARHQYDVMRYGAQELHAEFGTSFVLHHHVKAQHHTPAGRIQSFLYCYCRVEQG